MNVHQKIILTDDSPQCSSRAEQALKKALWIDDDLAIEKAYNAYTFNCLINILTQEEQQQVDLALERLKALRMLQDALLSDDSAAIIQVYDNHAQLLRRCSAFRAAERLKVNVARQSLLEANLQQAIRIGTESAIISAAEAALDAGCNLARSTLAEVRTARQRLTALHHLEKAIASNDEAAIVFAYNPTLLDDCQEITLAQKHRFKIAKRRLDNQTS